MEKGQRKDLVALEEFLTEFARFLLAAGVSFSQFDVAAQTAFVNAAVDRARLRNSRINQSAVAAITGLTRTTIRAILKGSESNAGRHRSRLLSLVYGWTTDTEFIAESGRAKTLPIRGKRASFQRLSKIYGGDVSERMLLGELKRLDLIDIKGDRVSLSLTKAEGRFARELRTLSVALAKTIQYPSPQSTSTHINVSGGEIFYETPSQVGKVLLRRRVQQGLSAFLTEVRASVDVATRTSTATNKSRRRMSKVSVLIVSQD
jgi:Family of unknown function (DUF6502)